ncbi:hypothetical protein K438DRAFT_2006909 [Mycena galopus ATCC 62051]|nr:hypothetical protein K438DRAFT_2006909 [Mycena galopus ATCC 62051]
MAPAPSKLGPLPWAANQYALTSQLITLLQKQENFVVLFGKKDASENTSSDRKITVYERIAKEMFPEYFEIHAKTLGKRVKAKAEDLVNTYKLKAQRLRVTGGGLGAPDDVAASQGHEYLDYYIPFDEQLNIEFPFFKDLHKFLSTRPNVVPPVITTGMGPQGRRIIHNQPSEPVSTARSLDESVIDPYLRDRAATPPAPSLTQTDPVDPEQRSISTNSRVASPQTPQKSAKKVKGPKPSTFGDDMTNAMVKARQTLQHVPKKRSLEDVIIESSRQNIEIARERAAAQAEHHRQNLLVVQKTLIMDLFKAGIKTLEEARAEIAALDKPVTQPSPSRTPRTPRTPRNPRTPTPSRIRTPTSPKIRTPFGSSSPLIGAYSPTRWSIEDSQVPLPEDSTEI